MDRKNRMLFLLFLTVVSFYSCDAPPCEDSDGVKANLGFYSFEGNVLQDKLIDSLCILLKNDSSTLFFDGTKLETGSIALPLSTIADSSTFIFKFGSASTDTLTFRYTQYLKLISHECGFACYFNITSYETTNNQIDSVWIRKDLIEYGDEENIKIYF